MIRPGVLAAASMLAALFVVSAPARADVVVHDGGVSRDSEAVELVRARTGKSPELVLSSDVLAGPTRLLASNATIERCEGGTIRLDPDRKLDSVVDQVLSFDLETALESLTVLDTLFPCAEVLIPRRLLAKMSFLRGAALLDLGREREAGQAMADALAFDPEYDGERGFPGSHLDLLRKQTQSRASSSRLSIWLSREDGAVYIDGNPREAVDGQGVPLRPGRHLIQVQTDGSTQGMWIRTGVLPGTIIHPGAGRRIWADGGASPGGVSALRMLLADEFGPDVDVHVIRFERRRHSGATAKSGEPGLTAWDGRPVAAKPKKKPRPEAPPLFSPVTASADDGEPRRVRIAIGGGYGFADPFHYGMAALDISGRPIGPLVVAGFARPGYGGLASYIDPTVGVLEGPVFLVPFGGSVGVQRPGPIAPYVRVGGQVALNRDGDDEQLFLGGVIVQGGIDLSPPGSPLLFRAQGEIGNLGTHVSVRGWAGVGVRF